MLVVTLFVNFNNKKKHMNFVTFRDHLHHFRLFSTQDIRKVFPSFDSRRLVEWQAKGYIQKVINRWYAFADVPTEEYFRYWTANRIYSPAYVSLQTALSYHGLIPEGVYTTTAVSSRKTKSFDTFLGTFGYRHLKPSLFFGYQVVRWQGFPIKIAEPEKALLDYLYLHPHLDSPPDWEGLRLNTMTLAESISQPKMDDYLELFGSQALTKRVHHLLNHLEVC